MRERILEAATELFSRRGYASTGMEEIGAAVGITAGGLYRHFRSKQAILHEIATRATEEVVAKVHEIVGRSESPEETLSALVDNLARSVLTNRSLVRVHWNEHHHLDVGTQSFIDRAHRLHVAEWLHVLSRLRPGLSDAERATLVEAVFGAMIWSAGNDAGLSDDGLYRLLSDIAMSILRPTVNMKESKSEEHQEE